MTTKPRVLIIYLCYGNLEYLSEVVSSFDALTYPKDRTTIMFVPNDSPDGITDVIKKDVLPRSNNNFPEVILVDDGENRGFAGGNNHGMRYAIEQDYDYVFLNNGDLKLHPDAITELVEAAEADRTVGSAQSLVVYWDKPDIINVSGGMVHIAGYGFARDNLVKRSDRSFASVEEITYSSGAAVLYRVDALRDVGLLEERFFMYHEDLELGLRLRLAGHKNVLASNSIAYHDYAFSRNPMKFAWMELYRIVVVHSYYRIPTLILFSPLFLLIEIGSGFMSLAGGWWRAKIWMYKELCKPSTWKLTISMRRRAKRLRKISDQEQLKYIVGTIEAQEQSNWIMDHIANPMIDICFRSIRYLIRW